MNGVSRPMKNSSQSKNAVGGDKRLRRLRWFFKKELPVTEDKADVKEMFGFEGFREFSTEDPHGELMLVVNRLTGQRSTIMRNGTGPDLRTVTGRKPKAGWSWDRLFQIWWDLPQSLKEIRVVLESNFVFEHKQKSNSAWDQSWGVVILLVILTKTTLGIIS